MIKFPLIIFRKSPKHSMKGKICLVTGGNAGIGKATAVGLAQMGATVVIVARSPERGEPALADIRRQSGNDAVDLLIADLSSQLQIRQLAADFQRQYPQLHVLVNNAGVIPPTRQLSEDGLEMQFAVNHLAYFLLTYLLLDKLKASAPARIVNVSSMVHSWSSIDFTDLQNEKRYDPSDIYAQTKLMNVLFTYELARRLDGTDVTVNCLHPGV
ncbi:MAG: SDR family NAD(P)-dependent oxidoreductase, partial [Chloroflexi bacterium]|nr:SDR family NAD(P)-dependent oxidoreductase [Chloroflexota bacterium]